MQSYNKYFKLQIKIEKIMECRPKCLHITHAAGCEGGDAFTPFPDVFTPFPDVFTPLGPYHCFWFLPVFLLSLQKI